MHTSESVEELLVINLHDGLTRGAPENSFVLAVAPDSFALIEPSSGVVVQEVSLSPDQDAPG